MDSERYNNWIVLGMETFSKFNFLLEVTLVNTYIQVSGVQHNLISVYTIVLNAKILVSKF